MVKVEELIKKIEEKLFEADAVPKKKGGISIETESLAMPEIHTGKVPHHEASHDTSLEASHDISLEASHDTSLEASHDISLEASHEASSHEEKVDSGKKPTIKYDSLAVPEIHIK